MNLRERRKNILELLKQTGTVQVVALAEQFSLSEVTIRMDLRILEEYGYLIRFNGGAKLCWHKNIDEQKTLPKKHMAFTHILKLRMAKQASAMVFPGASVILDGSSTTLLIAEELVKVGDITVITNNIPAANILSSNQNITLVLCGGMYNHKTRSLHGSIAESTLAGVTADLLFVSADGIDPKIGITTFSEGYAISAAMANAANRVIAIADSSRYGRSGFNQVLSIEQIDTLIIDDGLGDAERIALKTAGVELLIV